MSRPDLFTFRWSIVLSFLLALFLGVWHLLIGSVPQDEIGLVVISRWWILLEAPPLAYMTIRTFGIGLNEDYHAMIRRYQRELSFWFPIWTMSAAAFLTSFNGGLPNFLEYTAIGITFGIIFLAGSRLLPPISARISRWRIWPWAKRWLFVTE